MTPEENAAYIMAQAACAMITAMGMVAENQIRQSHGHALAYDGKAFDDLIDHYGISHNAVITTCQGIR